MNNKSVAFDYLTGALTGGTQPTAVGTKFAPDRTPLINPGCTTLCHIDPSSAAFDAICRAQDALKEGPLAKAFAFLPPASFHMTIFDAFIESGRTRDRVPAHLPMDSNVQDITHDIEKNLIGIDVPHQFHVRPVGIFAGFSVSMTGFDAQAEQSLRTTRDRISDAIGIRRPDHDSYQFHITLAYNLRWFSTGEAEDIIALSEDVGAKLLSNMPSLTLGPVELCRFETMHHFAHLRILS